MNLDEQTKKLERGLPLAERPRSGHIGFQELSRGGTYVQIRGARIKETAQAREARTHDGWSPPHDRHRAPLTAILDRFTASCVSPIEKRARHENPPPQCVRTEAESPALPEVRRQAESAAQTLQALQQATHQPAEEVACSTCRVRRLSIFAVA